MGSVDWGAWLPPWVARPPHFKQLGIMGPAFRAFCKDSGDGGWPPAGTWDLEAGFACAGVLAELLGSPQAGEPPYVHFSPLWNGNNFPDGWLRGEGQVHPAGTPREALLLSSLHLCEERGSVSPGGHLQDALGNRVHHTPLP